MTRSVAIAITRPSIGSRLKWTTRPITWPVSPALVLSATMITIRERPAAVADKPSTLCR
jgi:hypothetical protein